MPLVLNAGDNLKVIYKCRQGAQIGQNVRYYRVVSTSVADMSRAVVADALSDLAATAYIPALNNSATYEGLSMVHVDTTTPEIARESVQGAGNGTAGATPLPAQTCGMITLTSGFTGRANRGRVYVPFPSTAAMTNVAGTPKPSNAYQILLAPIGLFHAITGGFSFVAGGDTIVLQPQIWRPVPGTRRDLTLATVRDRWGCQRSRGNYGRENP